jgi:hypothetical protein
MTHHGIVCRLSFAVVGLVEESVGNMLQNADGRGSIGAIYYTTEQRVKNLQRS